MTYPVLRSTITLLGILFLAGLSLGCMTVVRPLSPSAATPVDDKQGVLLGAIRLAQSDQSRSANPAEPAYMKWWIQDDTDGRHILLSRLPLDGPFAVKLPPGSYRITDVSFHTDQGVWHTELPTAFHILSRECTSVGMWKLELQEGFRAGWITRQVADEKALHEGDLGSTPQAKGCPTVVASLDPEGKQSVRLSLRSRGDFDRP